MILSGLIILACQPEGADGPDEASDPETSTHAALACDEVALCTTWSPSDELVEEPASLGGQIVDGLYRRERGGFSAGLLLFAGGEVLEVGGSFENLLGTVTAADGVLDFTYHTRCGASGTSEEADMFTWQYPYAAIGDSLFLGAGENLDGTRVWSEYVRVDVTQVCTESEDFGCYDWSCSCSVSTGGFGDGEDACAQ